MKKQLVIGAVLLVLCSAIAVADAGLFVETELDLVPGTDGYIPEMPLEVGWESPVFSVLQTGDATAELSFSIIDPNMFEFGNNLGIHSEVGMKFGNVLDVDLAYGVTLDSDRLEQGELRFADWNALASLVWMPVDYAEIEIGARLVGPRDATPFARFRVDF